MKKIIWIPLVILIVGVVIALAAIGAGGLKGFWVDRGGFHLANTELGELVKVDEKYNSFKNIEINADFFDRITIKEGDAFAVRGQNYERFGGLSVELDGDTLRVESRHDNRWDLNIGVTNWGYKQDRAWLDVTYPKGSKLSDVRGTFSAARVTIKDLDCETITIKDDFGDVDLESVTADKLTADLSAGRLQTKNISAKTVSASSDFGKIEMDGTEADSLTLKLSAGDLSSNDTRAGNLNVKSDFGKVALDRLAFTGQCEIKCSSGDVSVGLLMNKDDLSYELSTEAGSVYVDGQRERSSITSRVPGSTADLRANADFGSVRLKFLS